MVILSIFNLFLQFFLGFHVSGLRLFSLLFLCQSPLQEHYHDYGRYQHQIIPAGQSMDYYDKSVIHMAIFDLFFLFLAHLKDELMGSPWRRRCRRCCCRRRRCRRRPHLWKIVKFSVHVRY